MKLSACIIAKNEEQHIERCLKSINPLVKKGIAEIILVDTGSKDKTIEIAKRYTDKVYFYEWIGDFAKARNYSISKAKGEYLLIIDADEEIEKEALNKIIDLFNDNNYKKFNAFTFKEKNFTDKDLKNFGIFTRAFIFKNSKDFFYTGSIHEQPSILKPSQNLDANILHYGYITNEEAKEKKFIRNSKMLKKALIKDRNNLYYRYQLALTYEVYGDTKEAIKEINVIISALKEKPYDKLYLLYYSAAAQIYISGHKYDKVIEICSMGLKKQKDFIDLIYNMVQVFFRTQKFEKSLEYAKDYLNVLVDFEKHDIFHDTRFIFYSLGCKEEVENIKLICNYKLNKIDLKSFIEKCKFVGFNKISAEYIINDLVLFIETFNINNADIKNLNHLKIVIEFVFERTLNSKQLKCLTTEQNIYIIDKYLKLGKMLLGKNEILNENEIEFFKSMDTSAKSLEKRDLVNTIKSIIYGVKKNPSMARSMEIYIGKIRNDHDNLKQDHEIKILVEKLKERIRELIQKNYIKEAEQLIKECEQYSIDEELYSMKSIVLIMNNNFANAEETLKRAIKKYPSSVDLIYNLAYLYEISENQVLALECYKRSLELCTNRNIKEDLINKIKDMEM